jgi:hypothetical protein
MPTADTGIGPEPTTDKFVCIMKGKRDRIVPGNAAVVDKNLPYTQLSNYGNNFLQRLEIAEVNSPVLDGITFVDSPGVRDRGAVGNMIMEVNFPVRVPLLWNSFTH